MVFKRREKRSLLQSVREALWPRGGWARAAAYVKHRLHRLPGSPERIARGIAAGLFTVFTPFYGMHFVIAASTAWILRGNILAAMLATFAGNPLTYVPIGVISLQTGYALLGRRPHPEAESSLVAKFGGAGADLWHNFLAMFTARQADWHGLSIFWHEVFFPYLIGGILPGIAVGAIGYYVSVPIIRAYQQRRKGAIAERLRLLKKKAGEKEEKGKAR